MPGSGTGPGGRTDGPRLVPARNEATPFRLSVSYPAPAGCNLTAGAGEFPPSTGLGHAHVALERFLRLPRFVGPLAVRVPQQELFEIAERLVGLAVDLAEDGGQAQERVFRLRPGNVLADD